MARLVRSTSSARSQTPIGQAGLPARMLMCSLGMRIFLSYRRGPASDDITGRIGDQLRRRFGDDAVFQDIRSIPYGEEFPTYLQEVMATADVLLAIIGRDWATAGDLMSEEDFVRVEVESALRRSLKVIPVLVGGAEIPPEADLPLALHPLRRKQALVLDSGPYFDAKIASLISQIERRPRQRSARARRALAFSILSCGVLLSAAVAYWAEESLVLGVGAVLAGAAALWFYDSAGVAEPSKEERFSANARKRLAVAPLQRVEPASDRKVPAHAPGAPGETGFSLDSQPSHARVIVDGDFRGRTPVRVVAMNPGSHHVLVELGGYCSWQGNVIVRDGSVRELPAVRLEPEPQTTSIDGARDQESGQAGTGQTKFRVLLVDDDGAALCLANALEGAPYEMFTAWDAEHALEVIERHDIHVVVSDEWMPGMRGVDLLAKIAVEYPYIVRILLTGDPQLDAAVRAINQGEIFRFLTKPCSSVTLDAVIREALIRQSRGKLQEDLMRVAGQGIEALQRIEGLSAAATSGDRLLAASPEIDLAPLTKREREVLEILLAEGSAGATGHALGVTLETVRKHLKAIFRKLGVQSQVELVKRLKR
jgi:two-component system probable response regulator PhcQ